MVPTSVRGFRRMIRRKHRTGAKVPQWMVDGLEQAQIRARYAVDAFYEREAGDGVMQNEKALFDIDSVDRVK